MFRWLTKCFKIITESRFWCDSIISINIISHTTIQPNPISIKTSHSHRSMTPSDKHVFSPLFVLIDRKNVTSKRERAGCYLLVTYVSAMEVKTVGERVRSPILTSLWFSSGFWSGVKSPKGRRFFGRVCVSSFFLFSLESRRFLFPSQARLSLMIVFLLINSIHK